MNIVELQPSERSRAWPARPRAMALAVVASLLAPGGASAETTAQQKAAAEALFEEATKLIEEGQFGAACERFEQSQRADPGVGTLLHLGRCYALTGRLASAWAIFKEAASAARASGQGDRARTGEENARDLRPRLSELALLVPAGQPRGFELLMDGNLVSSVQFGLSVPVDAGQHVLLARAPGYEPWSTVIQVSGGAARKTVQVATLEPIAAEQAPSAVSPLPLAPSAPFQAAPSRAGAAAGPAADTGSSGSSSRATTGLIVAGGGLLAIGGGVAIGLHAKSKDNDAKEWCVAAGCFNPRGEQLNRSARKWALTANVFYGIGAVALGTGAYLYFSAENEPRKTSQNDGWQVVPTLDGGPGVLIDGKF